MGFFADDCELCMPRGTEPFGTRYLGKPAVRAGLATRFAGIPDVHYGEDTHWMSGHMVSRPGCLLAHRRQANHSAFGEWTSWSSVRARSSRRTPTGKS
ncbi:MAG: hypothetical protein ABIZ36_02675 [Gemmatimonadaceae bacterium]